MRLKGKCKDYFEVWFPIHYANKDKTFIFNNLQFFYALPISMQYGVYVDFFESIKYITEHDIVEFEQSYISGGHSRSKSRIFTLDKGCRRYNQNIK